MQRYTSPITLTILGPFLTAATGPDQYGQDKSFHRNLTGQLVIPASHVKGKLRMALEELAPAFPEQEQPLIDDWFGREITEDRYSPAPGSFKFSDLCCDVAPQPATRTRTAMHALTLTAQEHLLREVEDPFASGAALRWSGSLSYFAANETDAQALVRVVQTGFRWLAHLGAEKGVGFGRLRFASVGRPEALSGAESPVIGSSDSLHLRITALEPLLVGGIKNRRTNYVESRLELSGGLIKGALAAALNQAHGVRPVYRKLDIGYADDFPDYTNLVAHFARIRISHALPTGKGNPRPVRVPLSTVEIDGKQQDMVLYSQSAPYLAGSPAPAYFVDWKSPQYYFGAAQPQMVSVTRSAIDDVSQRTLNGQLFTYTSCAPLDEKGQPIEWVCNVDFGGIADENVRQASKQEFAQAVTRHLRNLGKSGRAVQVEVGEGRLPAAQASNGLIVDGLAIVTLQSDALILSPDAVRGLGPGDDLHDLYAAFWSQLAEDGAGNGLELVDFYAHQGFEGGYLYHRYLGSGERPSRPFHYRPYYLTKAGSVFILRVLDESAAQDSLSQWLQTGLPLPEWAAAEYAQYDREPWENSPFVPENGYGEIGVNLNWHWEKRI